jgi:DNA-binding XRE family transcriptional regulator
MCLADTLLKILNCVSSRHICGGLRNKVWRSHLNLIFWLHFCKIMFMQNIRKVGRQWRAKSSGIYLYGKQIQFTVSITSTLPRKARRAILLNLFRAFRQHGEAIHLDTILHSDEALSTQVSAVFRGMVGRDAQGTETDRQVLGIYLRHLRTKRGLTQQQLAEILGVHRAYWSLVEHGRRCPSSVLMRRLTNWVRERPLVHENFPQTESISPSILH